MSAPPGVHHRHPALEWLLVVRDIAKLRVLATIVTHNAPLALQDCLHSITNQTRPPEAVIVVDNASLPPAEDLIASHGPAPGIRVLRQDSNTGPAGGHAAALREFASSDYDVAWVMDDDCVPSENCLESLLREGVSRPGAIYIFPRWIQPDGMVTYYPAWCGFLIEREIVHRAGVPIEALFWWAEDTEYLMWRIPRLGYPLVHASSATVRHTQVRKIHGNPPWKYYYETRNNVYYHVYVKRNVRRLPRKLIFGLARAVFRERQDRIVKLAMIARGVLDGLLRRLGKRVPV